MSDEGSVAGAEQTEELDVSIPLMGTRLAPPAQGADWCGDSYPV